MDLKACIWNFIILLVMLLSLPLVTSEDSDAISTVKVIDVPTFVLDMHVPAAMDLNSPVDLTPGSLSTTTDVPITLTFGDNNGQEDIVGPFIAKVFDEYGQQAGDAVPITVNPSTQSDDWVQGHGKAQIPYYQNEGLYYVFIYQIINSEEVELLFGCSDTDPVRPACDKRMKIDNTFYLNGNMAIITEDVDFGTIDPGNIGTGELMITNVGSNMEGALRGDIISSGQFTHDFDLDPIATDIQVYLPTGYRSSIAGIITLNVPTGTFADFYGGTIVATPMN